MELFKRAIRQFIVRNKSFIKKDHLYNMELVLTRRTNHFCLISYRQYEINKASKYTGLKPHLLLFLYCIGIIL